jgi:hypothetical protein
MDVPKMVGCYAPILIAFTVGGGSACADAATTQQGGSGNAVDAAVDSSRGTRDAGAMMDAIVDAASVASVPDCTESTGAATTFRLVNRGAEAVTVGWLRPIEDGGICQEANYGLLPANMQRDQPTYVGHVWAVHSSSTNALLLKFVVLGGESISVP